MKARFRWNKTLNKENKMGLDCLTEQVGFPARLISWAVSASSCLE